MLVIIHFFSITIISKTDLFKTKGKTTLAKILSGWSTRNNFDPLFVSLDVAESSLTIPGKKKYIPHKFIIHSTLFTKKRNY